MLLQVNLIKHNYLLAESGQISLSNKQAGDGLYRQEKTPTENGWGLSINTEGETGVSPM